MLKILRQKWIQKSIFVFKILYFFQVEDRLKYFETGEITRKNLEVMKEALNEAGEVQQKVLKKKKKALKRAKKAEAALAEAGEAENGNGVVEEELPKKVWKYWSNFYLVVYN